MNDSVSEEAAGVNHGLTPVCAIGASAGGVKALQSLFSAIETDLGLAYVVIVHLAPDHPSHLVEILQACTGMSIFQVTDSPELKPNCVYVISPDRELVIEGNRIKAREFREPRGLRAPIDMFFRSVAEARNDGYAIVLTGAGADGAVGVRKVAEAGGLVLVQDPREAEFAMMPRSAIATGVANFVEPLAAIPARIAQTLKAKAALASTSEADSERAVGRILSFLRARTGHDFASYKMATVRRRIGRRMQVTRQASLNDYADYLVANPEEAKELFGDLLISVTSFFRDSSAFDALEKEVIPDLFKNQEGNAPIRIWTVGCATGEEAYSLAILMLEEAERRQVAPNVQIFASDLDDGALATAREGRYPRAIEADVSEDRLRRFFVEEVAHYRIRKDVRDMVLFAHHSAMKDPPFMRLDLVTCRNLLIYLERELQGQLLALFHYALRPGSYLFLGSAETADGKADLFAPIDREARLYCAKPRAGRKLEMLGQLPVEHRPELPPLRANRASSGPVPGALHLAALENAGPPSALVDEDLRVVHLSANAGRFIAPPEGPLSTELPDIVRAELRAELRNALHSVAATGEPCITLPINVTFDGAQHQVALYVARTPTEVQAAPLMLVVFMDGGASLPADGDYVGDESFGATELQRLRHELRLAQERLSSSRREHESAIQELRIANEELQSVNEEYRSTAEELETSKEEMQSINEELRTVNSELKSKLAGLASAHSDLQNLINTTDIGTLFLDAELRIKMLTPAVEKLFSVTESDIGRPITDFSHKLDYTTIEDDARTVMRNLLPFEKEVKTKTGRWLLMRLRPYRTVEDRIDGIVASFIDITQRLAAQEDLRLSEARYERMVKETASGAKEPLEEGRPSAAGNNDD
jgi:two-component system, chemotaxis family, CheB/CheR fusion protein